MYSREIVLLDRSEEVAHTDLYLMKNYNSRTESDQLQYVKIVDSVMKNIMNSTGHAGQRIRSLCVCPALRRGSGKDHAKFRTLWIHILDLFEIFAAFLRTLYSVSWFHSHAAFTKHKHPLRQMKLLGFFYTT